MPPAPPSVPQTSARALFAQECTHDTHYLNQKGDLYTALITGGNRLLMLKNGSVVAQSGPLFDHASSLPKVTASHNSVLGKGTLRPLDNSMSTAAWRTPCVYVLSICRFTDDVLRLAVATTAGIFVFEFDDAGLLWQDTRPSSFWRTTDRDGEDCVYNPCALAASVNAAGSSTNRYPVPHGRSNLFQAPAGSPLGLRSSTTIGSSSPTVDSSARADVHLERHSGMSGRLRWRRVAFNLEPSSCPPKTSAWVSASGVPSSAPGGSMQSSPYRVFNFSNVSSNSTATSAGIGGGGNGGKPVLMAPVRVAVPAGASAVRAMDFVSEDALCVVLETETVLIILSNSTAAAAAAANADGTPGSPYGLRGGAAVAAHVADRVVWRTLGAYRSLAVCHVNHHIALALGHSSLVVFASRVLTTGGRDSDSGGLLGDDGGHAGTTFSTATSSFFTTNPTSDGTGARECTPAAVASALGILSDSRSSSVIATPAFSPTNHPMPMPTFAGGAGASSNFAPAPSNGKGIAEAPRQPYITLAKQGLTVSVGIYHITDMRWHCVSSHTLLCVTCSHPREGSAYMMLYTVQSLSTARRYTNVMAERADGGWGLCRGGYDGGDVIDTSGVNAAAAKASENLVQLVPAGVIALTYTSTLLSTRLSTYTGNSSNLMATNTAFIKSERQQQQTMSAATTPEHSALSVSNSATTTSGRAQPPTVTEMHTSLVPKFSRSAEANSAESRMEFLHVEGDGTVRTSSYSFGRQKHASYAKQRAVGLTCTGLLHPLLHLYGSLVRVTVLPTWRTRPIELGHHTGKQPLTVEVLLNASRRYRLVVRFTSGVLLSVMVDLSAAVYRVESYLALGRASLLSLRTINPFPELKASSAAGGKFSQTAIGTTTMLLVGLLDFPPSSSPPAGKPKRLLTASPSFLEEGEVDLWGHVKSFKASWSSSASSVTSASRSHSTSPAAASETSAGAAGVATGNVPPSTSARSVWGVVLLQVEPSGLQARVLTIAPLSEINVAGVTDALAEEKSQEKQQQQQQSPSKDGAGPLPGKAVQATFSDANEVPVVTEEDVARFIIEKCPEKLKFMPALLKAAQQDTRKLLTQLIAKHGPLEKKKNVTDNVQVNKETDTEQRTTDAAAPAVSPAQASRAAQTSSVASSSPSFLRSGCVTKDGEVVLLLTAQHCDHVRGNGDDNTNFCPIAAAALVRIRPSCLEAFAPVQKLVAAGSSQVPFVPIAAEYIALPAALQQRWRALNVSALPGASTDAQYIYDAYQLCCRLAAQVTEKRAVQCEVVLASNCAKGAHPPYVRVRSPLTPDAKMLTSNNLTAFQYLPLPDSVGYGSGETSMLVEDVKGVLQVNNDVVVGVLCRKSTASPPLPWERGSSSVLAGVPATQSPGVLFLYGCPAVQSLAGNAKANTSVVAVLPSSTAQNATTNAPPYSAYALEATLTGVEAFYLSTSGEVVVLRRSDTTRATQWDMPTRPLNETWYRADAQELCFERWLRCFPGGESSEKDGSDDVKLQGLFSTTSFPVTTPAAEVSGNGYSYQQDPTWCPPCSDSRSPATGEPPVVTAVTTIEVAGAWESNVVGLSTAAKLTNSRAATRPVLYTMADNSFIHLRQVPLRSGGDLEWWSAVAAQNYNESSSVNEAMSAELTGMPQYHPDAVMQLIGMARWSVLAKVLTLVLNAAKAVLAKTQTASSNLNTTAAESLTFLFSQPPDELARRLCTSAVPRGFRDRPQVMQYDVMLFRVTPPRLPTEALRDDVETPCTSASTAATDVVADGTITGGKAASIVTHRLYDLTATCGSLFAELTEVLPQVTLTGLSSQEQLNLLCILQALRDTLPLSRSVDEAAARYLFFTRLISLGRRLRLPNIDISTAVNTGVPVNSVLYFEVGRTATRTVSTAAYLWAAMSDSQSTLVSLLFDKTSTMYLDGGAACAAGLGPSEVTWEQVEQSGAAFWLRSAADLRALADRVARHQYQRTKDLTACALMYCAARKVGTLAALAKAQNKPRLNAFFSRDFAHDEHHRAAASANAYAAIGKNLPQYGAAFFLLAGDVRSAVQVLLQRCRDPFLALFVLRTAGEGVAEIAQSSPDAHAFASSNVNNGRSGNTFDAHSPETLLQWYVRQRTLEVDVCGPLDMWETACLSWIDVNQQTPPEVAIQRRVAALQRIAAHPTAHPEALCALRYARDGVAALSYRGTQFLSPAREVICLLRLGRYCLAHRLNLSSYLHYRDAEGLLRDLRTEAAARRDGLTVTESRGTGFGLGPRGDKVVHRPLAQPKMAADFNTGTLIFRGFESDADEDVNNNAGEIAVNPMVSGGKQTNTAGAEDAGCDHVFVLSDEADAAVQAEMHYAYIRTGTVHNTKCNGGPASAAASPFTAATAASYEDVLRRMFLCFTAASSFMSTSSVTLADGAETATYTAASATMSMSANSSTPAGNLQGIFQGLLTQLLSRLFVDVSGGRQAEMEAVVTSIPIGAGSRDSASFDSQDITHNTTGGASTSFSPRQGLQNVASLALKAEVSQPVLNGSIREPMKYAAEGWYSLCIPLLHLLLGKVALQQANYLVLLGLQRIPVSTDGVLAAAEQAGLLHDLFARETHAAAAAGASSPHFTGSSTAAATTVAGPSFFTERPSPLYLPLVAFFMLLSRQIMRHYREACKAEEEGQQGSAVRSGRTNDTKARNAAERKVDDTQKGSGDDDEDGTPIGSDPVQRSMFEALMAAAVAAEPSDSQSGTSSPDLRCGGDGGHRSAYPYDGNGIGSTAMRGADDEDLLSCCGDSVDSGAAAITEAAQVAFLLSCCQSQLQLRLLEHLRHLVRAELQAAVHISTPQRPLDAVTIYSGPLSPAAQTMLAQRRILLATMLLDVTTQWGALAEETMLRLYMALPRYAPGPLTDPNGVFLEVRLDVLRMRAVLVALLAGPRGVTEEAALAATSENATIDSNVVLAKTEGLRGGTTLQPKDASSSFPHLANSDSSKCDSTVSTTKWIEENTVMLLELCTMQLELFWTLPSHALTHCRQLAAPTRAALRLLRRVTALHGSARRLLAGMLREVEETSVLTHRSHTVSLAGNSSLGSPLTRASLKFPKTTTQTSSEDPRYIPGEKDDTREMYCPALSFLQLAWMRRHHTHALLRWLLLGITLDMSNDDGQRPLLTDRLILTQHDYSVTGVQFDLSSCDSIVCTTEAGTSIGHGFRELLAGDNEEALWSQSTERNLATAVFTEGLTAQQERLRLAAEHQEGTHTPAVVAALAAKSVLEGRPRCAVAANAMPSSHPHLPFFLARHRDGHIDLYPYASQECLASFCCALRHGQSNPYVGGGDISGKTSGGAAGSGGINANLGTDAWAAWGMGPASGRALTGAAAAFGGQSVAAAAAYPSSFLWSVERMERHAVTPVAFSPNGYIIAAGLSDGSVAGWRFSAAAVESAPAFTFPLFFAPYGIRACTFCGDRSSLIAVVGLTREPHLHPRVRVSGGAAAATSLRPPPLNSSFALTPVAPATGPSARTAAATSAETGELVGEVLIFDTVLDDGVVTARCALPFVPSYAVYLTPLQVVLIVSLEGLMATYSMQTGRLAVIATMSVTSVLNTLLCPMSVAGAGGAATFTGNTTAAAAATGPGAASASGGIDSAAVLITCVAKSAYDPLVAFGTSKGLVLLLHLRHIRAAMKEAERRIREEGEDVFVYYPPSAATVAGSTRSSGTGAGKRRVNADTLSTRITAKSCAAAEVAAPVIGTEFLKRLPLESVLTTATCVQVAPQVQSRSAVEDIVFSPSMLLAGLRDGKVIAAAVIAQATRTRFTAGSTVSADLLETVEGKV